MYLASIGPSVCPGWDENSPELALRRLSLPGLKSGVSRQKSDEIAAATPDVPHSFDPDWSVWCREVERFEMGPSTTLVGHSTGAGFWVKYLSIHPDLTVNKVVLVAPWLDPDRERSGDFFNFDLDPDLAERTQGVVVFSSDDDQDGVQKSVRVIGAQVRNVKQRDFHSYGHFCYRTMGTGEFPELLAEVLC